MQMQVIGHPCTSRLAEVQAKVHAVRRIEAAEHALGLLRQFNHFMHLSLYRERGQARLVHVRE